MRVRMRHLAGSPTAGALAGLLVSAAPAAAGRVEVHPGPNAIQDAIDGADPGDVLLVHHGTYHEAPVVDKRLTLRDAGDGRPTIDAECSTDVALDVQHLGVTLKGLRVIGTGQYDVNLVGIQSGSVHDMVLRSTCKGAEYGINVYDGGHLDLAGNRATAFTDAGIYVGGITDTAGGTLRVRNNDLYGNTRGLIVEEALKATDIVVHDNRMHDNTLSGAGAQSGIYVNISDGVVFEDNRVNDNGEYGIQLTSESDHNRFFGNLARHNGTKNFLDDNGDNCGAGNSFSISPC